MKLFHPLDPGKIPEILDRYANRQVWVYSGKLCLWLETTECWNVKGQRATMDLHKAISTTAHCADTLKIELHFIDDLGENKTAISEFEPDEVYQCTAVTFDGYNPEKLRQS